MRLRGLDEMTGAEKQGRAAKVVGRFLKHVRDMTRVRDPEIRLHIVHGLVESCGDKHCALLD